jgi:hypothetical protein
MTVPAEGFCVPALEDPAFAARTVRALEVAPVTTKPIAVLSTGVDADVPDLAGRVLPGADALTGGPISGDRSGHGTQAAGAAAGAGPGWRGISPGSPVLPIRIAAAAEPVRPEAVAKGIALAVKRGAGVILIGGSGPLADPMDTGSTSIATAVAEAFSKGVLVVALAGDDKTAAPTMPGALPHVLTAGSIAPAGTRSTLSNSGPWLDLLAPGEGVAPPLPAAVCGYGYGYANGSSFSAAALAGAAALAQARHRAATAQQLFELVRRGAEDLGPSGHDADTGFGLLDVARALSDPLQPRETQREVDDDPFWVRGAHAKAHPPLVNRRKLRFRATASVSPAKDPADVFPVSLRKGDRITVAVDAADPGATLLVSILAPTAGDFDVTNAVTTHRLAATGGLAASQQVGVRVKRSGLHFVAVRATDPVDADDPEFEPSPQEPYQLVATLKPAKGTAAAKRAPSGRRSPKTRSR